MPLPFNSKLSIRYPEGLKNTLRALEIFKQVNNKKELVELVSKEGEGWSVVMTSGETSQKNRRKNK